MLNVIFKFRSLSFQKEQSKENNFKKIFKGFYLYHYIKIGAEFIKQLRLQKKLLIKNDYESQHSLINSVFKGWKMLVDERKKLKKYLKLYFVEEKRRKCFPKNMPK